MKGEHGSVSVYALVIGVFLGLVAGIIVQVTALIRLDHEVAKAADLAALAASQASVGGSDGCQAARQVAERNNAVVISCEMYFDVADVTTRGESRTVWGQSFAFQSKARAAPLDYVD